MPTFADVSYRYADGNMNSTDVNSSDRLAIDNLKLEKNVLKNCELMNIEITIRGINVMISAHSEDRRIFMICAADDNCNFLSFSEFLGLISG